MILGLGLMCSTVLTPVSLNPKLEAIKFVVSPTRHRSFARISWAADAGIRGG